MHVQYLTFFELFATYLCYNAKKADGEPHAPGSCSSYFGNGKEYVRKRWSTNNFWTDHDGAKTGKNNSGGWFTRLNAQLIKDAELRDIEAARDSETKPYALGNTLNY